MDLQVLNLQARQSEVMRLVDRAITSAELEPAPSPYHPPNMLAHVASQIVESACHIQELLTVMMSSFDPSLAAHLHSLSRRILSIAKGLTAAASLSDGERASKEPRPPREATATFLEIARTMAKSVKELVTAIVSLSNKNYRPLGIMPTGQDLDNLVGQFSKTVVRYVSVVKTDIKGEFAEAAVDVVQAVAKIHSYVIQSVIPPDVTDVDMYQINREIILNGVISQTKTFAATSKSAASLWPPPKANETAIDTARDLASNIKELALLIKNVGGGYQLIELISLDELFYDIVQRLRAQGKSVLSLKLDSKTKALVSGISKLLDPTPRKGLKEDAYDALALIQQAVNDIVMEVEALPGFINVKNRAASSESSVADIEEPTAQVLPPIMSDIVKGIRKLIEEINSGYATSEDYIEAAHTIGHLGQQLLSQLDASDPAERFSSKLKLLIRATKVAAGSWAPPEAITEMSSAAYDLAISLKDLRDLLESTDPNLRVRSPGKKTRSPPPPTEPSEQPRSLSRAFSGSNLDQTLKNGQGYGVVRSLSNLELSKPGQGGDGFSGDAGSYRGDGITQELVACLSNLVLAVKILNGPNPAPNAAEIVKVASQALAKTTKLLISAAIAHNNQVELSGRREIFNNEISDLLETKGKQNGPAYGKINSDEYPTIPSDIPFLPPNEAMSDDEFKCLMDDDLSNLILELDPNSEIPRIKAGSILQLVRRLIFYKYPDPDFTEAFLLTYHSFMTPVALQNQIAILYDQPPPLNLSKDQFDTFYKTKVIPTRLRVVNVLKAWIDKHFEDFEADEQLEKALVEFLTCNKTHHYYQQNTFTQALNQLKALYYKKKKNRRQSIRLMLFNQKAPISILPKTLKKLSLLDLDPLELARQITDIEANLYRAIQPKECLNQSWNKPDLKHQSPNIIAFIHRFNSLTKKVVVEILKDSSKKGRAGVIKHFLHVAEKCMALNNFNALTAIMAALTSSPVRRLAKTWELVPKKYTTLNEQLDSLVTHHSNYDKYRKTLHRLDPPCVPFLGVYLTDLVFIEDGNKDKLNDLINFDKRRKVALVIREIQQYQQTPYCLKVVPEIQALLLSPDDATEDDLYKLSLELEPRK